MAVWFRRSCTGWTPSPSRCGAWGQSASRGCSRARSQAPYPSPCPPTHPRWSSSGDTPTAAGIAQEWLLLCNRPLQKKKDLIIVVSSLKQLCKWFFKPKYYNNLDLNSGNYKSLSTVLIHLAKHVFSTYLNQKKTNKTAKNKNIFRTIKTYTILSSAILYSNTKLYLVCGSIFQVKFD